MLGGGTQPKKAPVGTQRHWTSGWVIKTHDNTIFDDIAPAWMPMPSINQNFLDLFRDMDRLGSSIISFKDPIDGDLWLEKELQDFETSSGKTFTPAQFKQYSKFDSNASRYSFTSELTKRLISDKISLNEKIAEALLDVNEDKKTELLRQGENVAEKNIVLTKEEIEAVKKRVRAEFKYDDSEKLTSQDCQELKQVLSKVAGYLQQGEDFEGDQKEIYEKCKKVLDSVKNDPYTNISEVRDSIKQCYSDMNKHFADNWGIRESFKKKMDNAFSDYINKYKKLIEIDELDNFKQRLGVSLYADTEEFYNAVKKSDFFVDININDYIGKNIPDLDNKYSDIRFDAWDPKREILTYSRAGDERRLQRGVSMEELKDLIRSREFNLPEIDVPLKIRLTNKFQKDLVGEFNINDLTLLETFEKISDYLPEGHVLTNDVFKKLRKQSLYGGDNSYAHFDGEKSEIFLSSQAIKESDFGVTSIHEGHEVASTLIHEIGHAVSKKLGRRNSVEYRRFVVECGWSWEQFQFINPKQGITKENNYTATGDDKDLPRYGSKSDKPLITDYAHKSPEEAFAEHYSVYSQYKNSIDKFLETGDIKHIEKQTAFKFDNSERTFGQDSHHIAGEENQIVFQNIYAELLDNNRNLQDHIRVGVIDPYYDNLDDINEKDVASAHIAYNKRHGVDNRTKPQPVFTIFDYQTRKHSIVKDTTDAGLHYSNKYLRRLSPTYSISKECYNLLSSKGYSHDQIKNYALYQIKDQKIPQVTDKLSSNTIRGLRYRGQVISSDTINKSKQVFAQMKKIWESEELKKALEELNILKAMNKQELTFKDSFTEFLKPYTDIIAEALKNKKETKKRKLYADTILRNSDGEILLLQRSYQDDFMPGKWWLPGGKIEEGEDPLLAAERELFEETGIDMTKNIGGLSFLKKRVLDDCTIFYFEGIIDRSVPTILDNEEHINLNWFNSDRLKKLDLLENADTILSMPTNLLQELADTHDWIQSNPSYQKLFYKKNLIDCCFNSNLIDSPDFLREKQSLKLDFNIIKSEFNKGNISSEEYFLAKKLVDC